MRIVLVALTAFAALALAACAHQSAEEEPTPQIRVVPGAASRSLWIGHDADAGPASDAGTNAAP